MTIDDELSSLLAQLKKEQQVKANPLSERTVAEIMLKLQQQGLQFYATTDGNEFVVPEHLDEEVREIVRRRGRVNLDILPQLLNLGLDTIESRLTTITSRSGLILHRRNLFSESYMRLLISNLRQKIRLEGRVELQSIAIENEFSMEFLLKFVTDNLEHLEAQLRGKQLITEQYTRMKTSRVLGFLSALTLPLSIDAFLKATRIESSKVQDIIEECIGSKRLNGRLKNGYYIPDRFLSQQKRKITDFFTSNGYIELEMMHQEMVERPQDWLKAHFQKFRYRVLEGVCFSEDKLESYSQLLASMIRSDGFIEVAQIIPFHFEDHQVKKFLKDGGIDSVRVEDGFCFSQEWLDRGAMEFQEKVIKSIFFKKGDSKPKGKKKPEQNIHLVEEKELVETLFNCGLAKYEEASNIAPILMPILLEKLQQLRESIERDLAQQKGVINANFLKYRSVRTIVRTPESMAMLVARIQKEKVKTNEPWRDVNFGPCESDPTGEYSLYYYDKVLPKNWPALDTLQWVPVSSGNLMKQQNYSTHTKRSHLVNLMEILDVFNIRSPTKIHTPFTLLEGILNIIIDSEPPFLCNFFVAEQAPRYVLVDQYLPFIEGTLFGCQGRYAFVEKAYAKLRYCYKGILGIGVQQLLLQLTGKNPKKYLGENENSKLQIEQALVEALKQNSLVVTVAEGIEGKPISYEQRQTGFYAARPYLLHLNEGDLQCYPRRETQETQLVKLSCSVATAIFKNIYVIALSEVAS